MVSKSHAIPTWRRRELRNGTGRPVDLNDSLEVEYTRNNGDRATKDCLERDLRERDGRQGRDRPSQSHHSGSGNSGGSPRSQRPEHRGRERSRSPYGHDRGPTSRNTPTGRSQPSQSGYGRRSRSRGRYERRRSRSRGWERPSRRERSDSRGQYERYHQQQRRSRSRGRDQQPRQERNRSRGRHEDNERSGLSAMTKPHAHPARDDQMQPKLDAAPKTNHVVDTVEEDQDSDEFENETSVEHIGDDDFDDSVQVVQSTAVVEKPTNDVQKSQAASKEAVIKETPVENTVIKQTPVEQTPIERWNSMKAKLRADGQKDNADKLVKVMEKYEERWPKDGSKFDPFRHSPMRSDLDTDVALFLEEDWAPLMSDSTGEGAWVSSNALTLQVLLHRDAFMPGSYFLPVTQTTVYLNHEEREDAMCVAEMLRCMHLLQRGERPAKEWPASDMPANTRLLATLWNTGSHWVPVEIRPNPHTKIGTITVRDSMPSDGRLLLRRATMLLPNFADFIGSRQDSGWNTTRWEVVMKDCPKQVNTVDCGLFATKACTAVLTGERLAKVSTLDERTEYGKRLRRTLRDQLFRLLVLRESVPSILRSTSEEQSTVVNDTSPSDHVLVPATPIANEVSSGLPATGHITSDKSPAPRPSEVVPSGMVDVGARPSRPDSSAYRDGPVLLTGQVNETPSGTADQPANQFDSPVVSSATHELSRPYICYSSGAVAPPHLGAMSQFVPTFKFDCTPSGGYSLTFGEILPHGSGHSATQAAPTPRPYDVRQHLQPPPAASIAKEGPCGSSNVGELDANPNKGHEVGCGAPGSSDEARRVHVPGWRGRLTNFILNRCLYHTDLGARRNHLMQEVDTLYGLPRGDLSDPQLFDLAFQCFFAVWTKQEKIFENAALVDDVRASLSVAATGDLGRLQKSGVEWNRCEALEMIQSLCSREEIVQRHADDLKLYAVAISRWLVAHKYPEMETPSLTKMKFGPFPVVDYNSPECLDALKYLDIRVPSVVLALYKDDNSQPPNDGQPGGDDDDYQPAGGDDDDNQGGGEPTDNDNDGNNTNGSAAGAQSDNQNKTDEPMGNQKKGSKQDLESIAKDKAKLEKLHKWLNARPKGYPSKDCTLDIIKYYEDYVEEHYSEPTDPERKRMNAMRYRVKKDGRNLPALDDVLDALPGNGSGSWASDEVMQFMLQEITRSGLPPGKHLVDAAGHVEMFVATYLDDASQKQFLTRTLEDNEKAIADGTHGLWLAEEMPASCTQLYLPYNPTDDHWVWVEFAVDDERLNGTIKIFNSMDENYSEAARKIRRQLPYLTKAICMRPSLNWQNVRWAKPTNEGCIQQTNAEDCGFFTVDSCRRAIFGKKQRLTSNFTDRRNHGRSLRLEFLQQLGTLLTGKAYDKWDGDVNETVAACPYCSEENMCARCRAVTAWKQRSIETWSLRMSIGDALNGVGGRQILPALLDSVVETVVDRFTIDEPTLRSLVEHALTGSSGRFNREFLDDSQEGYEAEPPIPVYSSLPGLGQHIGFELEPLWTTGSPCSRLSDDIDSHFHIRLATVRRSAPTDHNEGFDQAKQRARAQMEAHHSRFSRSNELPREIVEDVKPEDMVNAFTSGSGCWMPYVRQPQTSRNPLLNDSPTASALLRAANEHAKDNESTYNVLLTCNGWDGTTTDNNSWSTLVNEYPYLHFRLTMVVPFRAAPAPDYARVDGSSGLLWFHYDVHYLAHLWQNTTQDGTPVHFCPRSEIKRWLETGETMCEDCMESGVVLEENRHLFSYDYEGDEVQPVSDLYAHAQFLVNLSMIDDLKMDHSILSSAGFQQYVKPMNPLATGLTGIKRNSFSLPRGDDRVCEECGNQSDNYVRGFTGDVTLRCRGCVKGVGERGSNAETIEVSSKDKDGPPPKKKRRTQTERPSGCLRSSGRDAKQTAPTTEQNDAILVESDDINSSHSGESDISNFAHTANNEPPSDDEANSKEAKRKKASKGGAVQSELSTKGLKGFQCPKCDRSLRTWVALQRHIECHSGQRIECDECGRGFTKKFYLLKHQEMVHAPKTVSCTVAGCPVKVGGPRGLKVHIYDNHRKPKMYQCSKCPNSFDKERGLSYHIARFHGPRLPCDLCDKTYANKDSLAAHMRASHEGNRP